MNTRLRRLRMTPGLRRLSTESSFTPGNLIYPMFVCEGNGIRHAVSSMPGIFNFSVDELLREVAAVADTGLGGLLLFGVPSAKDDIGASGCGDDGIVQKAVRALKAEFPHLVLITDVCLCEYTTHGHCGILDSRGTILNDKTVEQLAEMAVSHARAGADIIAPSDMMDLRIAGIRKKLNDEGYTSLPIMSYAVKFASAFYGPFREAAQSAPSSGNRKSHQLNPANRREALREAMEDVKEGADILMVKPASHYLDLVRDLREMTDLPLAAYQVSGEYSMIKAAAHNGWLNENQAVWESIISMRRAGADLIITYFAKDIALNKLSYNY